MKITFLKTAYEAIGFNLTYTGKFIKVGDHYIESNIGDVMTLQFPKNYITCGKMLCERK